LYSLLKKWKFIFVLFFVVKVAAPDVENDCIRYFHSLSNSVAIQNESSENSPNRESTNRNQSDHSTDCHPTHLCKFLKQNSEINISISVFTESVDLTSKFPPVVFYDVWKTPPIFLNTGS
jgi:hypothetical protein